MPVTEDGARNFWCPCTRFDSLGGEPASNRHMEDYSPGHARCIASDCMFWRWGEPEPNPRVVIHKRYADWRYDLSSEEIAAGEEALLKRFEDVYKHEPAQKPVSDWEYILDMEEELAAFWIEPEEKAIDRRTGYCGLAGKPDYRY